MNRQRVNQKARGGAQYAGHVSPLNQSETSKMEAAIKKLAAIDKRKLVDKTSATARKLLFG